jgi:hypothetical protein
MLHSIWARKLFCFVPSVLGLAMLLTLWLFLPHPAESGGATVCPSGCDYTTIQAAVTNVAEGSTILVAAGVYTESVLITQSLTLEGASAMSTTITANTLPQYTSVMTISEGITVTLKGFQISGGTGSLVGDTGYGGGIYNLGVTNLVDSTIIDNDIESAFAKGGGIYNQGSMSLENVLLKWNSAFNVYAYGGAI